MGRYIECRNSRMLQADVILPSGWVIPTFLLSYEKDSNKESVIRFPLTTQFNVLVLSVDIDSDFTRKNSIIIILQHTLVDWVSDMEVKGVEQRTFSLKYNTPYFSFFTKKVNLMEFSWNAEKQIFN